MSLIEDIIKSIHKRATTAHSTDDGDMYVTITLSEIEVILEKHLKQYEKAVEIKKKKDKYKIMFYNCPACEYEICDRIDNYCRNCGVKIIWTDNLGILTIYQTIIKMPETKKYAIICHSKEQTKECEKNNLEVTSEFECRLKFAFQNYTIVTYEEAVGLGLLGEKGMSQDGVDAMKYAVDMAMEVKEESKIEEDTHSGHIDEPTIKIKKGYRNNVCPNCDFHYISQRCNYCSHCGLKIERIK